MPNKYIGGSGGSKIWQKLQDSIAWMTSKISSKADQTDVAEMQTELSAQSEAIGQKVSTVKIAGTSLAMDNDCAVDIPVATMDGSTIGVIRVSNGSGGIGIDSDGKIWVACASESQIDRRAGYSMAITAPHLDYAVKAALTDDKRDTTYTDAQKTNACDTIGAIRDKAMERIVGVTLEEDTNAITITKDEDGNDIDLRSCLLLTYYNHVSSGTNIIRSFIITDTQTSGRNTGYNSTSASRYIQSYLGHLDGIPISMSSAHSAVGSMNATWLNTASYGGATTDFNKITGVTVYCNNDMLLGAGTRITVYGVRRK